MCSNNSENEIKEGGGGERQADHRAAGFSHSFVNFRNIHNLLRRYIETIQIENLLVDYD